MKECNKYPSDVDIVELAESYSHLDKGVENLPEEDKRIALKEYDAFISGFNQAYSKAITFAFEYMLETGVVSYTKQEQEEFHEFMKNKLKIKMILK